VADTFDEIGSKKKRRRGEGWKKGGVEVRRGRESSCKIPSPFEYQLINRWCGGCKKRDGVENLGRDNIFDKVSRSVKSLNIYY
jgi:hypothetical protein